MCSHMHPASSNDIALIVHMHDVQLCLSACSLQKHLHGDPHRHIGVSLKALMMNNILG